MVEERKVLVQVRLSKSLVKEVDHWRIDNGLTRAQAVERLLEEALKDLPVQAGKEKGESIHGN